jgi:hypothetical protein
MAVGLVLCWLWLRTESVGLLAIADGSLNSWGQYAFKYMTDAPATDADLLVLGAGFQTVFVVGTVLLSSLRGSLTEPGS